MRKIFLALTTAIAMLLLSSPAGAATPGSTALRPASLQSDVLSLVNGYRAANGLGAVSANGSLAAAATWMATDMATKNYFSHTSADGRSPQQRMAAFGYPAYSLYTGEDIAAGQTTAADVFAAWRASPAHNGVMLSPSFNAVGIGVASSPTSTYKWYWVADFGGPGGNVAAAPSADAPATPRAEPIARGVAPVVAAEPVATPTESVAEVRAFRRLLRLLAVLDRS